MKPNIFESSEAAALESIASNKVQIALMPLAYEEAHPGESVNMTDPEEKRQVVAEWLEQNSALYREYIETHAEDEEKETIDLTDDKAVHELWKRIKAETKH